MMPKGNDKTKAVVDRGHELLQAFLSLQNEQDGIDRPDLFSIDKSKTLDQIAMDVTEVATYLSTLIKLVPMQAELTDLGRRLESEGKISVLAGDSYSDLALEYIKSNV